MNPADDARFVSMFGLYYPRVLADLRKRTGSADGAFDVAQSTFTTAWRALNRVPEEPATLSWLLAVAHNELANHWRSERRARRLYAKVAGAAQAEVARDDDPGEQLSSICYDTAMARALARLPVSYRQVVILAVGLDVDRGKVAKALGCSRGAIENRLSRARTALYTAYVSELDRIVEG